MNPNEMAQACAAEMWQRDAASQSLGMVLDDVGPGTARLSMRVLPTMLNGHKTCHGGFIFTLADSAFAFACNTSGMGAVASHCSISFIRPAREGDHLIAVAEERQSEGRSGIFDVRVVVGEIVIAEFRGHSRTTGQRWVPNAP